MTANEIIQLLCKVASMFGTTETRTVNPADPTSWTRTRLLIEMPYQLCPLEVPDPKLISREDWCQFCGGEGGFQCRCPGMEEYRCQGDYPIPEIVELVITECYDTELDVRSETYGHKGTWTGKSWTSFSANTEVLEETLRKLIFDGNWTIRQRLTQWNKVSGRYRRCLTLEDTQRLWFEYLEEKAEFEAAEDEIRGWQ